MSTVELRHIITEHLSHIEDASFLNAIKTILESKVSEGEYKLSDYQKKRVDVARNELKRNMTTSHNDLQIEIDQWLNTK
ncbi:hypothetical protein KUV50_14895 [Membranicola marinus]|uniref:Uncharacterized protein n=1 Tax=Membranihabitans marinus TaxID=1227546 RepID=A0A953HWG8_9BACT|nr:hypothetical protein [Membranihabitans marinus]MBY5959436.1 hypothetical protein [Membranihabitans marinus]